MSRLIQAITNNQIKKKYNTNNIYTMNMNLKQLKNKVLIYLFIIKQIIKNFVIDIYIKINEFQKLFFDDQF